MTAIALDRIGKVWVKAMKQKIRQKGKVASGNLLNSISYRVVMIGGSPTLEITYADYITYVNQGRRARGEERPISAANGAVPIKALVKWIKQKGLSGALMRGRTSKKTLSLAFAIRASIWKYGIPPADLYDETLDNVWEMLNPANIPPGTPDDLRYELNEIWEAMYDDFNVLIDNMIDNLLPAKEYKRK